MDGDHSRGKAKRGGRTSRQPRRDAERNRERVLAAAVSAMLREGRNVPLAAIAAEAGVGVGTLYRHYPDREALLQALEHRAYTLLSQTLVDIQQEGLSGIDAVREYLSRTVAVADQLVLPLHGAPPLLTDAAVQARQDINDRLTEFIVRGRADGSIRAAVTATDVIIFSALLTQPLTHSPDWARVAQRQIAIYTNGLAGVPHPNLPGPAPTAVDIENTFAGMAGRKPNRTRRTPPR
jgi:AcrR family transcriptional regulator